MKTHRKIGTMLSVAVLLSMWKAVSVRWNTYQKSKRWLVIIAAGAATGGLVAIVVRFLSQ